jgi:hypothetical protein
MSKKFEIKFPKETCERDFRVFRLGFLCGRASAKGPKQKSSLNEDLEFWRKELMPK